MTSPPLLRRPTQDRSDRIQKHSEVYHSVATPGGALCRKAALFPSPAPHSPPSSQLRRHSRNHHFGLRSTVSVRSAVFSFHKQAGDWSPVEPPIAQWMPMKTRTPSPICRAINEGAGEVCRDPAMKHLAGPPRPDVSGVPMPGTLFEA